MTQLAPPEVSPCSGTPGSAQSPFPVQLFPWLRWSAASLNRCRLHPMQHRLSGAATGNQDGQRDRCQRKHDRRPRRHFGQNIDGSARAKSSLRALAAKRARQVRAGPRLQQDDTDQEKANGDVKNGQQINHRVTFDWETGYTSAAKTLLLVRKGGLEPPCLSAPPPQDGVSAISPLPQNALTATIPLRLHVSQASALQASGSI